MRVAALTTGKNDPSARFRVRQHIAPLGRAGIDVHEYVPLIDKHAGLPSVIGDRLPDTMRPPVDVAWRWGKLAARMPGLIGSRSADLVWLNRELLPGRYTLERLLSAPIALDVDDAVWLARPDGANTMARLGRKAQVVLAGNRYIAEWFAPHARSLHIVPTAIDTDRFRPANMPAETSRRFAVGWTGSSGNFGYLYEIEKPLDEFLRKHDARLLILAERPPSFARLAPQQVEFRAWSQDIEATALQDMDVGLMPLPDREWTRGKCSFKMLQYMSTELPVVVSPVGMNDELLAQGQLGLAARTPADWFDALEWMCTHREAARAMGRTGRQVVLASYSQTVVSRQIAAIFRGL